MVAAPAAVRPVSLRRLGALVRAPAPCGLSLTTSRIAAPFPRRTDSMKISQLQLTATRFSKENNSNEDDGLLSELRDKWDAIDKKSSLAVYGAGAILIFWVSLVVVKSLDSVPLLPGLLELVGLSYSGWFVYRYLLFQAVVRTVEDAQLDIKSSHRSSCPLSMPDMPSRYSNSWLVCFVKENRKELAELIDDINRRIIGDDH